MKIHFLVLSWLLAGFIPVVGQVGLQVVAIRSSGETTGIIYEMVVRNTSSATQTLAPATYFIPSDGQHQRYVARVRQPQRIEPGVTQTIPLFGYCADISRPAVPKGEAGTPFSNWVAIIRPENVPIGLSPLLPQRIRPPWPSGTIPNPLPFQIDPLPNKGEEQNWYATWPGTDSPIGGAIDIDANPAATAPLLVTILEQIDRATYGLQQSGRYRTPYGANPRLESTTIIQHSFWLAIAVLSGDRYSRQDFRQNILRQLGPTPELAYNGLTRIEKTNTDLGINDFWQSFEAVGISAKVISQSQGPVLTTDSPLVNESTTNVRPNPCEEYEAAANAAERDCRRINCQDALARLEEARGRLADATNNLDLVRQNLEDWDANYLEELESLQPIMGEAQRAYGAVDPARNALIESLKNLYTSESGRQGIIYDTRQVLERGGRYLEVYPGVFIERNPSNTESKEAREAYARERIRSAMNTAPGGQAAREALDNYMAALAAAREADEIIERGEARRIELSGQRKALRDAVRQAEVNLAAAQQELDATQANYDACTRERNRICGEAERLRIARDSCARLYPIFQRTARRLQGSGREPGSGSDQASREGQQALGEAENNLRRGNWSGVRENLDRANDLARIAEGRRQTENCARRLQEQYDSLQVNLAEAKTAQAGDYSEAEAALTDLAEKLRLANKAMQEGDYSYPERYCNEWLSIPFGIRRTIRQNRSAAYQLAIRNAEQRQQALIAENNARRQELKNFQNRTDCIEILILLDNPNGDGPDGDPDLLELQSQLEDLSGKIDQGMALIERANFSDEALEDFMDAVQDELGKTINALDRTNKFQEAADRLRRVLSLFSSDQSARSNAEKFGNLMSLLGEGMDEIADKFPVLQGIAAYFTWLVDGYNSAVDAIMGIADSRMKQVLSRIETLRCPYLFGLYRRDGLEKMTRDFVDQNIVQMGLNNDLSRQNLNRLYELARQMMTLRLKKCCQDLLQAN